MGLGGLVALGVDGNTTRIDATLSGPRVHPPFQVVNTLRDLRACKHLIIKESHIRILMATIRPLPRIHRLRIKHEVLRLRHHLIPRQQTLTHVIPAPRTPLTQTLRPRQIIHQLPPRPG